MPTLCVVAAITTHLIVGHLLPMSGISQSLAGRVALLHLLPLGVAELRAGGLLAQSPDRLLLDGGYPPVHDRRLDPAIWYANYVQTYLERDVRQLSTCATWPNSSASCACAPAAPDSC